MDNSVADAHVGKDLTKSNHHRHHGHESETLFIEQTGEHIEWVGRDRWELFVLEMQLSRERFFEPMSVADHTPVDELPDE